MKRSVLNDVQTSRDNQNGATDWNEIIIELEVIPKIPFVCRGASKKKPSF